MTDISARFAYLDDESIEVINTDEFAVKLDPDGALTKGAAGVGIAAGEVTEAMLDTAFKDAIAYRGENETIGGEWTFSNPVTGADATSPTELATLAQVHAAVEGLKSKGNARTLEDVDDIASLSGVGQTVGGITTDADDVVVLAAQTDLTENGAWIVKSGAWVRPANFANGSGAANAIWSIEDGDNADTRWWVTNNTGDDVVGTDDLVVEQFTTSSSVVAGNGLDQSGNTVFITNADASITVNTDSIAVNVDDSTIETDAGGIQVKAAGITEDHIATSALGAGLQGGSGTVISINSAELIRGGAAEIDGDQIDIDYSPTNYTPATGAGHAHAEHASSHFKGIDNAIGAKTTFRVFRKTLDGTDISNKYVTLITTPAAASRVEAFLAKAGTQYYGDDYQMDGGNPARLTWDSLGWDGKVVSGDKITVIYDA